MMRAFLVLLLARILLAAPSLSCFPKKIVAYRGEKVYLNFTVQGISASSLRGLSLSYHLYDLRGRLVRFENQRFYPPARRSFSLPVFFTAPAGNYTVEFELLREGKFWGKDRGWKPCRVRLSLKSLFSSEFRKKFLPRVIPFKSEEYLRVQYLLRLTYLNNEIRKGGRLFGFSAGSHYSQVWIRDMASIIPYAREFYDAEELKAAVELFLRFQHRDGEVFGWISPEFNMGKNTVSSDQEASLVLASFALARQDPSWLCRRIRGERVVDRLAKALMWVWKARRDSKTGLIWSGFKADWGDVSLHHPQDPTHFKPGDLRAVGIYTQARFYRALQALKKMEVYCPLRRKLPLGAMARSIKRASRKYLYLPQEGYFLIHRVLGNSRYLNLERKILAVGGNAEAILAGFMSRGEVEKFLKVHRARMKDYGVFSPSFVLLPPYPQGFFRFHLMKPWHYQNGGGWDWIGARLARALMGMGFEREGEEYLKEIVRRNLRWLCLYEWFDLQGRGKGAFFYTASAGEIGQALLAQAKAKRAAGLDPAGELW